MMPKLSCRGSFRLLLSLVFGLLPLLAQGQTAIRWITAGSSDMEFQKVLFRYLQSDKQYQVQNENIQAQELEDFLSKSEPSKQKIPLVVQCTLDAYEQLLRKPDAMELLSRLELRLSNPRLFSVPFYLLSFPDEGGKTKPDLLQVAFITLPVQEFQSIQEVDLLNVFSEILGRPKNSIRIFRERDAYTAAKNFYSGAYHLVGIYEDEPSTLLDEFEVNLTQELKAGPPKVLSPENRIPGNQMHEVAPARLGYVFFIGKDPLGSAEDLTLVALTQEWKYQFPIILSNLPRSAESSLSVALSYAYFMALPSVLTAVDGEEQRRIERTYLYNAFLNDPDNRLKGMAFLSYLMLMKDRSGSVSREKELFEDKFKLFLKTLNLDQVSSRTIFDWLGVKIPKLDKRRLFTDDVSKLYQDALSKIDTAIKSSGDSRVELLEGARKDLIAAILHDDQPKNIKGSRGLWSATNYNPYYELARTTFYLQLEGRK